MKRQQLNYVKEYIFREVMRDLHLVEVTSARWPEYIGPSPSKDNSAISPTRNVAELPSATGLAL